MTRLMTSLFLAVLLVDVASAVVSVSESSAHEPPRGLRRMIETLEKKNLRAYGFHLVGTGWHTR